MNNKQILKNKVTYLEQTLLEAEFAMQQMAGRIDEMQSKINKYTYILYINQYQKIIVDDNFAKNLGAQNLTDLKKMANYLSIKHNK